MSKKCEELCVSDELLIDYVNGELTPKKPENLHGISKCAWIAHMGFFSGK
jgi:hypothetical protein